MRDYTTLSDAELLGLLRSEEERFPRAAAEEIVRRGPALDTHLIAMLEDESLWAHEGKVWWVLVHATRLLATGGRPAAFQPVLQAIRRAHTDDFDWMFVFGNEVLASFGPDRDEDLVRALTNEDEEPDLRVTCLEALGGHAALGKFDLAMFLRLATSAFLHPDFEEQQEEIGDTLSVWIRAGKEIDIAELLGGSVKAMRKRYPWLWETAKALVGGPNDQYPEPNLLRIFSDDAMRYKRTAERDNAFPGMEVDGSEIDEILEGDDAEEDEAPAPIRLAAKVGRNDPCPCGSGKKYKKCCEGKEPSVPDPRLDFVLGRPVDDGMRDIRELFKLGLVKTSEDLNRLVVGKTTDEIRAMVKQHRPPPSAAPHVERPEPVGTGHFDIEVALREIAPRIWRRFLIADSATFLDLHEAIQDAGGWTDEHLFAFRTPDGGASVAEDPRGDERPHADRVRLRDVLAPAAPTELLYEYDFGDSWEVDIRCHGLVRDAVAFHRRLAGGARAFPADDCGGVGGYEDCVAACTAKKPNADQRERLDWLGKWRPEAFDLEKVAKKFDRAKM